MNVTRYHECNDTVVPLGIGLEGAASWILQRVQAADVAMVSVWRSGGIGAGSGLMASFTGTAVHGIWSDTAFKLQGRNALIRSCKLPSDGA